MRTGSGTSRRSKKLILIYNRAMHEEKDMKEIERKCLDDEERAQQEETKRRSRGREQRYAR